MFFISLLVCIVGGALFGTVAWLSLAVIAEKSLVPLITFPVVLISAIPLAIPFGSGAAVIATILFNRMSRGRSSKGTWALIGSVAGVVTGSMLPLVATLVGFGPMDGTWAGLGGFAGLCCGSILGLVGWTEVERKRNA